MSKRGEEREKYLDRESYYSENYFNLHQLCSFAHQIHDIHKIGPTSILEIGIGNGFTSTFLKRAGFSVTTVDINCALQPDICASIAEIKDKLQNANFDLVVCCEVLEHMPFENFESSLKIFRSFSEKLYLTLPVYNRLFGFGGFFRIPKIGVKAASVMLELPINKKLEKEHFWEIGFSSKTTTKSIRKILLKYYTSVNTERYVLNPYHRSFLATN